MPRVKKETVEESVAPVQPATPGTPAWVSEGSIAKYHRAVKQLRNENKPVTDEAVKELYVGWGGLVLDVA